MRRTMWTLAVLSGLGLAVFAAMRGATALSITLGTVFYHFAMRLAVGYAMLAVPRRFDARAGWFAERKWERRLYARLNVRKWKHVMPSYNPEDFDLETHTSEEIVQTMCVSELVHEIIIVLSFVPVTFAIPFGELAVFVITSVAAAVFDSVFVIIQRFNRPRVLRLIGRMCVKR